jgi:SAM-dependent methyltransferase
MTAAKPVAPHCARNREPILEALRPRFASRGRVLEIGSGTGEHAVFFAPEFPGTIWQTSDREENLPGIRLWIQDARRSNLPPPLLLDVNGPWPQDQFDAVFTANTLHIMSWPEVGKLFAGLDRILRKEDAIIAVYGPFNYGGRFTSPSNEAFESWLKQQSPVSGIRDFEAVNALAAGIGFTLAEDRAMPANNRLLFWTRP